MMDGSRIAMSRWGWLPWRPGCPLMRSLWRVGSTSWAFLPSVAMVPSRYAMGIILRGDSIRHDRSLRMWRFSSLANGVEISIQGRAQDFYFLGEPIWHNPIIPRHANSYLKSAI